MESSSGSILFKVDLDDKFSVFTYNERCLGKNSAYYLNSGEYLESFYMIIVSLLIHW